MNLENKVNHLENMLALAANETHDLRDQIKILNEKIKILSECCAKMESSNRLYGNYRSWLNN